MCIGGGVTVIVVHEGGLPRFVRMLGTGGRALTDAIASELELSVETAEALKRQGDNSPPELAPRVTAALERPIADLIEEVRSSLDYWRTQPGSSRLLGVTLTGGVSLQPGLAAGLSRVLGIPVDLAAPREGIEVGDIGFPPDEVGALDPYLPVPIGLALGGSPGGKRINLAGADSSSGPADTRKIVLVAAAVGLALLLLLGLLSFQKQQSLSDAEDELSAQQAKTAKIQSQITALSQAQTDQAKIDAISTQVGSLLQNDVSWSVILQQIARTIPDDTWLTRVPGCSELATAAPAVSACREHCRRQCRIHRIHGYHREHGPGRARSGHAVALGHSLVHRHRPRLHVGGQLHQADGRDPGLLRPLGTNRDEPQLGGRTVVNFTSNAALTAKAKSDRLKQFTDQDKAATSGAGTTP